MKTADPAVYECLPPTRDDSALIDEIVQLYRDAVRTDAPPDLSDYLPEKRHTSFHSLLHQLILAEMEATWERQQPRRLTEFRERYPEAFTNAGRVHELVRCEVRHRIRFGESPDFKEYHGFAGSVEDWSNLPITRVNKASNPAIDLPEPKEREDGNPVNMPRVGDEFLGFKLITQIGQGAFAKVFLARQSELGNRLVVLKVSREKAGEAHVLAQLLHTNIVPIYSLHESNPLHATCMPFLGSTTLADVLREVRKRGLPDSGNYLVETLQARSSRRGSSGSSIKSQQGDDVPQDAALKPGPHWCSAADSSQPATRVIWDNLKSLRYSDAVLWLGLQLADGLAHAHERGILHRDIKPANVLLTDEGRPMLLDFNLAEDTKLRNTPEAARLGGTLMYMSPEQMRAFKGGCPDLDERSDVFSLGVILFEWLTGRFPYTMQTGPTRNALPVMLSEREAGPPSPAELNRSLSPAVDAIIRRCLEPNIEKRYRDARQLQEDLQRQLDHQPLKNVKEPSYRERLQKWRRRHPRLTSFSTVVCLTALLAVVLATLYYQRGERLHQLRAIQHYRQFDDEVAKSQLLLTSASTDESEIESFLSNSRKSLAMYRVLQDPDWRERMEFRYLPSNHQRLLTSQATGLLLMMGRANIMQAAYQMDEQDRRNVLRRALQYNQLAERVDRANRGRNTMFEQRAEVWTLLGDTKKAKQNHVKAESLNDDGDAMMAARERLLRGEYAVAAKKLQHITRSEPKNAPAWFLLGRCHERLGEEPEALTCFSMCIALRPASSTAFFQRGLIHLRLRDFRRAERDFSDGLALQPDNAGALFNRAVAHYKLKTPRKALADLDAALENNAPFTRVYFLRARVRDSLGDRIGAGRDRRNGLKSEPNDVQSWNTRGFARLSGDPDGALSDFRAALNLNPHSRTALANIAYVLAHVKRKPGEAIAVLDTLLAAHPNDVTSRASRSLLLAKVGRREGALADAEECLKQNPTPATMYRIAGVYALTSKQRAEDREKAMRLLRSALQKGYGFSFIERDANMASLRNHASFRELIAAVRVLRK